MTEPIDEGRTAPGPEQTGADRAPEHESDEQVRETAARRRAHGLTESGRVRRTRASGAWVALILVAILVVLMLIFIGQNTQKVAINFLWLDGQFSLGIALLFAAVAGILMVALPGAARIVQLRRALRKNQREASAG